MSFPLQRAHSIESRSEMEVEKVSQETKCDVPGNNCPYCGKYFMVATLRTNINRYCESCKRVFPHYSMIKKPRDFAPKYLTQMSRKVVSTTENESDESDVEEVEGYDEWFAGSDDDGDGDGSE
jgi:hypothetical protein